MKISLKKIYFFYRLFLIIISIKCISPLENIQELTYVIENYYSLYENKFIDLELDKYISGTIEGNNINYYNTTLLNDSEQLILDYQSDSGCLNIYFNKNDTLNETESDFVLCSKGTDSIFYINKSDIIEKINEKDKETLEDLNIIIGVGYANSEINKKKFKYSLKISLKKPNINIYEINSEHKILCKTERIDDSNFKCLFVINDNIINNNTEKEKKLIIYPFSQIKAMKLNIYADFIDKEYYNNWDTDILLDNIPNNNSYYNNLFSEQEFIYIPINDSNKYIYICVESSIETTIEMLTHSFYNEEEIKLPEINEIKVYTFNQNYISFNFNSLINYDNSLSVYFGILNGKTSIYWEYDDLTKYIIDEKENLVLNLNYEKCYENKEKCNLIVNDIEYNEKNEINNLGNIFYISLIQKDSNDNVFDEIVYGKSIKFSYENRIFPLMLYSQILDINSPININLQLYQFSELDNNKITNTIFDINIMILSIKDVYNIKKDHTQIVLDNSIKGYFDPSLLASNIYLSIDDIKKFNIKENPCIFIYISYNYNINKFEKLILGSTISQLNSLIKPSERIYHYGVLKNENKVVYRLGGDSHFHLMRLEIGLNNNNINWSVKRNNNNNYMYNDSDISFVTEKWINGRGLVTIYIENGEDIYLTFFNKNQDFNLTNFIFKYINAAKNGEFKNYYIKKDTLSFNKNNMQMSVNEIKDIPNSSINYYLKIIGEENYIKNELINTISISQSLIESSIKGTVKNNKIIFLVYNEINDYKIYYINVNSIIIDNNLDIEYVSYNGLIIHEEHTEKKNSLKYIIIGITSGIIFISICKITIYIIKRRRRRRINRIINRLDFLQEDSDYFEEEDDDELLS